MVPATAVQALRRVVQNHERSAGVAQSDSRTALRLRGLALVSRFARALGRCAHLEAALGRYAHTPLCAHTMPMNHAQINVGAIGDERSVDAWHIDSVDYVLVVMLSDTTDMEGGELQVVLKPKDAAIQLVEAGGGKVDPDQVLSVPFPGPGYAILMQGSLLLHRAAPVRSAREPRLTLVNSYMSRDVFAEDRTRLHTFLQGDPREVACGDYARHRCWRVKGIMEYVMRKDNYSGDREETLEAIERAIDELQRTRDLLVGVASDPVGFFDETTKKFVTKAIKRQPNIGSGLPCLEPSFSSFLAPATSLPITPRMSSM